MTFPVLLAKVPCPAVKKHRRSHLPGMPLLQGYMALWVLPSGLVVDDSTKCSSGSKLPYRLDFSITNRNHLAVKEYGRVTVVWHHRDPLSWC